MQPFYPTLAVKKYLDTYADKGIEIAAHMPSRLVYDHAVAVPCYAESDTLPYLLKSLSQCDGGTWLCVIVVNSHDKSPSSVIEDNHETLTWLSSLGPTTHLDRHSILVQIGNNGLLRIDHNAPGNRLSHKEGVGMARKIACDLALALITKGHVRHNWIHTTDSDVWLPKNFFSLPLSSKHVTACVAPWVHLPFPSQPSQSLPRQLAIYDAYLRYFPEAARMVGSPYAFPTIGSCLSFDGIAYAKVRGFPRKAAGEDFYLMNKLAKIGTVSTKPCAPLQLSGRESARTPFGTGKAVRKIREEEGKFAAHSPLAFMALGCAYRALGLLADGMSIQDTLSNMSIRINQIPFGSGHHVNQAIEQMLRAPQVSSILQQTSRCKKQRLSQLLHWFDGFRSIKFLNSLIPLGLSKRTITQAEEFDHLLDELKLLIQRSDQNRTNPAKPAIGLAASDVTWWINFN